MKAKRSAYIPNNRVQFVRGGCDYFDLLHDLIKKAQTTIHLQFYIFDDDETGTAVVRALARAAERGVKVYVLLDAYGSQDLSKETLATLSGAGVFLRRFSPIFKGKSFYLGRRLHHKVVVVDSSHALVAGLNISDRYNDMPESKAWLDWALHVQGEVVPALEEICASRLRLRRRGPYKYKGEKISNGSPVRIRVNDWLRRKTQIYRSYFEMFRDAQSHMLLMSAYFLPGRPFRKKIKEAIRRGVKVRVVVTGDADIFMIKYAERYIYRWLFKNKIEVYEYRKNVLHGKLAMRDSKWMTLGSFNVNNLSAYHSIELNLDVNDPKVVAEVEAKLEKIIAEDCVKITEDKFNKKYNRFNLLVHKMAYEIFRFLFFISTRQRGD